MWSGTVAFGLVSLPVSLYPATRSTRASLRLVDESGTPLERRYFSSRDGRALERDDLVRGFALDDEHYVVVEDEELEALAPERSQEIDLSRFVTSDEIPPSYFERSYFLAPDRGALKAYRLLARSMEDTGRTGIATFVMRDTEYLVAILAEDGILRAQILRFHDEVRTPDDVGLAEFADPDPEALEEIRGSVAERTSEDLDRSLLRDSATRRLLELVTAKREAGEDLVELAGADRGDADDDDEEIDLMQVLKRSLAQDEGEASTPEPGPGPATQNGLQGHTKEELYQRARELSIDGRSRMTKDELIDAIRAAS
jgi:DNA end-binding protein Ku